MNRNFPCYRFKLLMLSGVLILSCTISQILPGNSQSPNPVVDVSKAILPQEIANRETAIPANAIKAMPEKDMSPPILHVDEWYNPVPAPGILNTAGAEDSPFITPDGRKMYFFFTPDLSVPHEKQLLDGVTGIYTTELQGGEWVNVQRVILQLPGKLALDGCPFVQGDTIWFCSAREGYTGLHWFTATHSGNEISELRIVEDQFKPNYEVGELHISSDQNEMYYHSPRAGGQGQFDIWVSRRENGAWQEPENITSVNSPEMDGWPFVSQDHNELWFTRTFQGTPAIYRSSWEKNAWSAPQLIVSQFTGEPTLDNQGNLYFVHHYMAEGKITEADIYVAYRK